jgi:hypothetical protein
MLVCELCGGSNIELKMWVNPNTNKLGDSASDGEEEDNYCNDCEQHVQFVEENEFKKYADAPEFLQKIDWKLLKEQKLKLVYLMNHAGCTIELQDDDSIAIEGIVELIDAIQDYATDVMGLSEKKVFNLTPEDNE